MRGKNIGILFQNKILNICMSIPYNKLHIGYILELIWEQKAISKLSLVIVSDPDIISGEHDNLFIFKKIALVAPLPRNDNWGTV